MHGLGEWHVESWTLKPVFIYTVSFNPVILCRYVLECASCGIIYRSRQFWIGNQDPESSVVRPEVKHVWQGVSPYITTLGLNVITSLMFTEAHVCFMFLDWHFPDRPSECSSEGFRWCELYNPVSDWIQFRTNQSCSCLVNRSGGSTLLETQRWYHCELICLTVYWMAECTCSGSITHLYVVSLVDHKRKTF